MIEIKYLYSASISEALLKWAGVITDKEGSFGVTCIGKRTEVHCSSWTGPQVGPLLDRGWAGSATDRTVLKGPYKITALIIIITTHHI